jgi:hypothetical protein
MEQIEIILKTAVAIRGYNSGTIMMKKQSLNISHERSLQQCNTIAKYSHFSVEYFA